MVCPSDDDILQEHTLPFYLTSVLNAPFGLCYNVFRRIEARQRVIIEFFVWVDVVEVEVHELVHIEVLELI
jgi:hypothetical protein